MKRFQYTGSRVNYLAVLLVVSLLTIGAPGKSHAADADQFDRMRGIWLELLTGAGNYDPNDKDIAAYLARIAKVGRPGGTGYWVTLDLQSPNGLWNDLGSLSNPSPITQQYARIKLLALAYATKGSVLYKNQALGKDIAAAMKWMYDNRYNERSVRYGNWWEWEIGAPAEIVDILVLMQGVLQQDLIDRYSKALYAMIPDPSIRNNGWGTKESGANLADKALIAALHGAIIKNGDRVSQAGRALPALFAPTAAGNGFYGDGSYIDHGTVPYTGSYGVVLIDSLANLMLLLDGSSWEVKTSQAEAMYNLFRLSFEPLMYDGAIADMVRGRAIARQNSDALSSGRQAMNAFLRISHLLPAGQAAEMKGRLKYWYGKNPVLKNPYYGLNVKGIQLVKQLLGDPNIAPAGDRNSHMTFSSMDRVMHSRRDYKFGISMYSDRISNYETMNGENTKGWFTGSGMTYLINGDVNQFVDGFWPTVDPYRLPGTTSDGLPKPSGKGGASWVGGSSVASAYGSAGMRFRYEGSGLSGNKSWFMFDEEVVAMGSGITADVPGSYETIIENRKLSAAGNEALTVNGQIQPARSNWSAKPSAVRWAHLAGPDGGAGIGYTFPKPAANVSLLREARTGSWAAVGASGSKQALTRNYMTMWFDHGSRPREAAYAYVLLPNKTAAETAAYSAKPDVRIVAQNDAVHAVQELTLGITAANFWKPGTAGTLRAEQPLSATLQERNGKLEVGVSDPTQKQQSVTLVVNIPGYKPVASDSRIQVLATSPALKLKVDVTRSAGRVYKAYFEAGSSVPPNAKAETLEALGLFKGTNKGRELDKTLTRAEAAVVLTRITGDYNEAEAAAPKSPFRDVKDIHWASGPIAYAASKGYLKGVSPSVFAPARTITGREFIAIMLRSIGYPAAQPASAAQLAIASGLLREDAAARLGAPAAVFTRGDMVEVLHTMLRMRIKGTDRTVLDRLVDKGAVTKEQAAGSGLD